MISLALEKRGFAVVCPDSPNDFLSRAKNERWDAYMLDTWMPDISGVELCRKLREFDPRTPIIFYSAAAYDRDRQDALACGAQAYIVKPASFDLLVSSLRSAIESA
jgi:DNA-binding response OmpR family regulator